MKGFVPHSELNCPGYKIHHKGEKYSYENCNIAFHREWMTPDGKIAVGLLDDGTIDEVLFKDGVSCHLESMGPDCIWMMLDNRYVFHFSYRPRKEVSLSYSYDNKAD